jgi:Ca2+:H+ antiporter
MCLFSAAYGKKIPEFNHATADALSSLMIITAAALILPTALYSTVTEYPHLDVKVLAFSRGSAVVLIVLYIMFLYFQLGSHSHLFDDDQGDRSVAQEQPNLRRSAAILITATIGTMVCTDLFIDSVDKTAEVTKTTQMFIGAIIIPIASNAPECATIVVASQHGRINSAVAVIVGSIIQIALFVTPFLVILGWIIQKEMTLKFERFQTAILFLAVLVVNRLLQDGKYTYIQGAMLVAL